MRWKKVMSGILAGVVLMTAVVPSTLLAASGQREEIIEEKAWDEAPETTLEEEGEDSGEIFSREGKGESPEEIQEEVSGNSREEAVVLENTSQGAEEEAAAPVAVYDFEDSLVNSAGEPGDSAIPVVKGLAAYEGEVLYEEGKYGNAVRLKNFGLQLNKKNLGKQYTVSMWTKLDGTFAENQNVLFLGHHNPEKWIAVSGKTNNTSNFKVWANDKAAYSWATLYSTVITPKQWHCLTLTGSEGQLSTYLDGKLVGTSGAADALTGENQDIYVGITNWDTALSGLVDEVKVYDSTLSPEEVYKLYEPRTAEQALEEEGVEVTEFISMKAEAASQIGVTMPEVSEAANPLITYVSKDPAIASVDGNGLVTGVSAGETVITTTVSLGQIRMEGDTQVTVQMKEIPVNDDYAVSYDMGTRDGGKLIDMSGHGNDAVIKNPETVSFKKSEGQNVMQIAGAASYLELPQSILDNLTSKEQFSVEVEYARATNSGTTSWLWNFGSNPKATGSNYLFYCPAFSWSDYSVRAGIKGDSVEKLFETSMKNKDEQFYTATMVFNQGRIELFIDGVKVQNMVESGMSIENDVVKNGCKNNILGYIGRSCWTGDANFQGSLKSFKIYDKAMTVEDVQAANREKYEAILKAKLKEALQEEDLLGDRNEAADSVRYDLTFQKSLDEALLTWTSDRLDIITEEGEVKNPAQDTPVTVTVTAHSETLSASQDFVFTVKALDSAELGKAIADAKTIDTRFYTQTSVKKLNAAVEEGEGADSQAKADAALIKLRKAVGNLDYLSLYKNPWDVIGKAAPAVKKSMKVKESSTLFTMPAQVKEMVDVVYLSSDQSTATYAAGTVTALKAGKVTVTVLVTSKYNDWVMEYSTALNITAASVSVSVPKVTGIKLSATVSSAQISWKKLSGVTGYEVHRYNSSTKTYKKISATAGNSYTDKECKSATGYRYAVRAYKNVGGKTYYGAYSGGFNILTKPSAPGSVKGKRITKVSTGTTAVLSFKKVDRASAYRIYKYNISKKKYEIAYRVLNGKLYRYDARKKSYTRVNNVKTSKNTINCTLTKLNLKKEKSQKYIVKATVSKSGYITQYSPNSKSVTIK